MPGRTWHHKRNPGACSDSISLTRPPFARLDVDDGSSVLLGEVFEQNDVVLLVSVVYEHRLSPHAQHLKAQPLVQLQARHVCIMVNCVYISYKLQHV